MLKYKCGSSNTISWAFPIDEALYSYWDWDDDRWRGGELASTSPTDSYLLNVPNYIKYLMYYDENVSQDKNYIYVPMIPANSYYAFPYGAYYDPRVEKYFYYGGSMFKYCPSTGTDPRIMTRDQWGNKSCNFGTINRVYTDIPSISTSTITIDDLSDSTVSDAETDDIYPNSSEGYIYGDYRLLRITYHETAGFKLSIPASSLNFDNLMIYDFTDTLEDDDLILNGADGDWSWGSGRGHIELEYINELGNNKYGLWIREYDNNETTIYDEQLIAYPYNLKGFALCILFNDCYLSSSDKATLEYKDFEFSFNNYKRNTFIDN